MADDVQTMLKKLGELTGKKITDKQLQQAYQFATAMSMKDSDPFLKLLIALEWYCDNIAEIPQKIEATQKQVVDNSVATAKQELDKVAAGTLKTLSDAVDKQSIRVARAQNIKTVVKWIAIAALALAVGAWFDFDYGYKKGRADGIEIGMAEARDEALYLKQRDAFTNTPEFRAAYKMYKSGMLRKVYECKGNGWEIRDGICYPFAVKRKDGSLDFDGWYMP